MTPTTPACRTATTRPARGRALRRGLTATAAAVLLAGGALATVPAQAATAGVDMQRACNDQYGAAYGYVAKPLNRYDAFSWRCTKPWDTSRGIDVNRACATQYGQGWSAGLSNRYDAYSWYCTI